MKRILSLSICIIMLSLVLSLSLTSQVAASDSKLTGKITFANNRVDLSDTSLKELANEFTKLNPGVTVEIEGIQDTDNILKTRFAAGEVPDVTLVPTINKEAYPNYFAPLNDLGYDKKSIAFYTPNSDGKIYTLQTMVSYDGIIYMKSTFAKAGITKVPRTEAELLDACKKLKAKGITPMASNFKDKWPLLWWYEKYAPMATANGNFYNDMVKSKTLMSPGPTLNGIKLLDQMYQMGYLEKDLLSTNYDNTFRKGMAAGKFGMSFLGTWFPAQLAAAGAKMDDIGMFPVPGVKSLIAGGDWQIAVSKNSKSIDAAKAFLKYLTDEGRYANAIGGIPIIKNLKSSMPFVNELLSFGLPVIEQIPNNAATVSKLNTAKWNQGMEAIQYYLLSKTPKAKQAIVDKYNKMWADAK